MLSLLQIGMWLLTNGPEFLHLFEEIVALIHSFPEHKKAVQTTLSNAVLTEDKELVGVAVQSSHDFLTGSVLPAPSDVLKD